jgi:hypothetical protein
MTAHKKTLIRQAGSAWAFLDSLPLVVNIYSIRQKQDRFNIYVRKMV